MRNYLSSSMEAAVLFKHSMKKMRRRFVGWGIVGIIATVGIFCVAVTDVRCEDPKLTPESIMKTNPDLYRAIQSGPPLPPPEVDPAKPYDPYPGFFAQPVLKPGQIEEWWENSSFEYSPVYPYLLKHTHLKFTFANSTGNDEGYANKGAVLLALRKGRFTNIVAYTIDKKNISSPDGSRVDKDTQGFEETAQYEFNRYLFAEAGFHWQRLSQFMILNRYIPVVGVGSYNVLQDIFNKKQTRLGLHLGAAWVKDEYYPMVVDMIGKNSDSFYGLYFRADFSHKFYDLFTFKSEFILKHAIESTPVYVMTTIPRTSLTDQKAVMTGSTKRYDWNWTNSLEFALNQYVGFLVSYTMAYDSNPWPIAAKSDTELMIGFKFAY